MVEMKRWLWLWLPVLVWCGMIFWWSSIPHLAIATGAADFWTRKPAHVAEYAVLFLLLCRALGWNVKDGRQWRIVWSAGILTILYAISDEWHQHFVPSWEGKPLDVVIDFIGVLSGYAMLRWYEWWRSVTDNTEV